MPPDDFAAGLPDLLRFAAALCGGDAEAAGLVAQGVARAASDLGSLDDVERARTLSRVWTVRAFLSEGMHLGAPSAADVDTPREVPGAGDSLDDRFARLSKLARTVLLLHYGAGLPAADVARTVGSTPDGIAVYLESTVRGLGVEGGADPATVLAPVLGRALAAAHPDPADLDEALRAALPDIFAPEPEPEPEPEPAEAAEFVDPLDLSGLESYPADVETHAPPESPLTDEPDILDLSPELLDGYPPEDVAAPIAAAPDVAPPESWQPGEHRPFERDEIDDLLDLSALEFDAPWLDETAAETPAEEPAEADEDTSLVPQVVAEELVESLPDDTVETVDTEVDDGSDRESEISQWQTVTSRDAPADTPPTRPVRSPRRASTDRGPQRVLRAGATQGRTDSELTSGRITTRRVLTGLLVVAAVILISVGIAMLGRSPSKHSAPPPQPHVSTQPIAKTLAGSVGLGTWSGLGNRTVVPGSHAVTSGRQLAVSVACSGSGPVHVGPLTQSECTGDAITAAVSAGATARLQVRAPAGKSWKFSLLDEPATGTDAALVPLPDAALDTPASGRVGAGKGNGSAAVALSPPRGSGLTLENVRILVTCHGAGVTLSSDDNSVVDRYAHTCFDGWAYEFDVTGVRLPTTLHVTAGPTTTWTLVAVPY